MLTEGLEEFKVSKSVLRSGVVAWAVDGADVLALGGEVAAGGIEVSVVDGIVRVGGGLETHLVLMLESVFLLESELVFLVLFVAKGCLCGLVVWADAGHCHPAWFKVAVSVAHYC